MINSPLVSNQNADVICELRGASGAQIGCITLNRPKALNALNLNMVRLIAAALDAWAIDDAVVGVAVRGSSKDASDPHFGHFCAGGDIRFFHTAALAGNPELEDFFTEEYALNHQISCFPKPMLMLLDGVVMGGGMGLCAHDPVASQRGVPKAGQMRYRIGTERTKAAMPETHIGLFPDVGGGWFLARCDGAMGAFLALTGQTLGSGDAAAVGWLDGLVESRNLATMWAELGDLSPTSGESFTDWITSKIIASSPINPVTKSELFDKKTQIDAIFGLETVAQILSALELSTDPWCASIARTLRKQSPLMLVVTLEQLRRARHMSLAEALRMERDMVRHCFHPTHLGRSGVAVETVEGIRALAVDKDQNPKWSPSRVEDVTKAMVEPFFASPWPLKAHPLRHLK